MTVCQQSLLLLTSEILLLDLLCADPTYMIRAIPSNASDNIYCTLLAQSAVHGAMAGYTGFTVGPVNGRHAYIPIAVCPISLRSVSIISMTYWRFVTWITD